MKNNLLSSEIFNNEVLAVLGLANLDIRTKIAMSKTIEFANNPIWMPEKDLIYNLDIDGFENILKN